MLGVVMTGFAGLMGTVALFLLAATIFNAIRDWEENFWLSRPPKYTKPKKR